MCRGCNRYLLTATFLPLFCHGYLVAYRDESYGQRFCSALAWHIHSFPPHALLLLIVTFLCLPFLPMIRPGMILLVLNSTSDVQTRTHHANILPTSYSMAKHEKGSMKKRPDYTDQSQSYAFSSHVSWCYCRLHVDANDF